VPNYHRQNLLICTLLLIAMPALLGLAAQAEGMVFVAAVVAFAFLGLTNYAMMHEAMHDNLHANPRVNRGVGRVLSWLFPVSFTLMYSAHGVHHRFNRTDHELFDYYYPDDNLLVKFSQWYSILIGIYPPIIPLGSVLLALVPGLFRTKPWQQAKSSSIIFNSALLQPKTIRQIRIDVVLGIGFWFALYHVLQLDLWTLAIVYAVTWCNWSTRQYVTHAFTPRDVIHGARNLHVSRLMGWVLLNGQWDLVHHQQPRLHWQQLPLAGKDSEPALAYWPQYFRLWLGPQPCTEPEPHPL
jgi:fatty acid desaturase